MQPLLPLLACQCLHCQCLPLAWPGEAKQAQEAESEKEQKER
jgi:hypothetical protein